MDVTHRSTVLAEQKFFGLWNQRWQTNINPTDEPAASHVSTAQPQHPHDFGRREGQPVWLWGKKPDSEDDLEEEEECYQLGTWSMQPGRTRDAEERSCSELCAPDDVRSCWICYETDSCSSLVSPCRTCCGSLRYVHRKCISIWIRTKQQTPDKANDLTYKPHCPNCKTAYPSDVLSESPSGWKIHRPGSSSMRRSVPRMPAMRVTTTLTSTITTSSTGTSTPRSVSSLSEVSSNPGFVPSASHRRSDSVSVVSHPRLLIRHQSITYDPIEVITVTPSSRGSGLR